MSSSFRFKVSRAKVSAAEISELRRICQYSISEITRRASSEESVLDIPVFSGEWPEGKARVLELLQAIERGALPLAVYVLEGEDKSSQTEEPLTLEQARERLQFFREVLLQQDMQAQLKEGHISSPEQYKPLPENEA